jgi:stearoyl-CoA desaturase (delta-9 desaturase)
MKHTKQEKPIAEQFLAAELDVMEELMEESKQFTFETQVVWRNVALFVALHLGALLGLYQVFFEAKWQTLAFMFFMHVFSGLGITAGAHRLWAHRSYKATLPARVLLMFMQSSAFQNDIIEWARDHRCHHKWTDTDADPHSTTRGFFFAHMGWLLVKKHPQVKKQGGKLDLSDLFADPVCTFQRRYYLPLVAIFCFLIPTLLPMKMWGESAFVAFYTCGLLRYSLLLHATWFINSAAHYFGYKPYDARISPVESLWTTVTAIGEGGHNYHHTFPQDYRTSEYSLKLNWTRLFIDTLAAVGLVYDRKFVGEEIIKRQIASHGDGHKRTGHHH